jgi:hypothetical protein
MATHTHIAASMLNQALEKEFMCEEGASLMNRKACNYLFIKIAVFRRTASE